MLLRMASRPLDLTAVDITRRLLAEPEAWRERAVERLDVGSAEFVHRRRSLQVRPLRSLLAPGSTLDTAVVVLPLVALS